MKASPSKFIWADPPSWVRIQHLTTPETSADYAAQGETLLEQGSPIVAYDQVPGIHVQSDAPTRPMRAEGPRPGFRAQVVGLLFADVAGFSRLSESETPLFVEHVLGTIAAEMARAARPPILANTWGDGLYCVFRDVGDTGIFALDLCEAMQAIDWIARGFRGDIALRVGLHAGPAYECIDPVTKRPTYIGAHVSRAARIEPITPPNEVYASGAFAALARAEAVREFRCSYVGQTPLAKSYGTFPTYVVHRRHGPATT
jgi:class 3 adenylate cyclase